MKGTGAHGISGQVWLPDFDTRPYDSFNIAYNGTAHILWPSKQASQAARVRLKQVWEPRLLVHLPRREQQSF